MFKFLFIWLSFSLLGLCIAEEKRVVKEVELAEAGTLSIKLNTGDLTIAGYERDRIRIEAQIQGDAAYVDAWKIVIKTGKHKVRICEKSFKDPIRRPNGRSKYILWIPQRITLRVKNGDGNIFVSGISGKTRLLTAMGDIQLESFAGLLDAKTKHGSIYLNNGKGKVKARAKNGDIRVDSWYGDFNGSTSAGTLNVASLGKLVCKNHDGWILIRMLGQNSGVHANVIGGWIQISYPSNISGNLDAKLYGGKIVSDLPDKIHKQDGVSSLLSAINGGGPELKLRCIGGRIELKGVEAELIARPLWQKYRTETKITILEYNFAIELVPGS